MMGARCSEIGARVPTIGIVHLFPNGTIPIARPRAPISKRRAPIGRNNSPGIQIGGNVLPYLLPLKSTFLHAPPAWAPTAGTTGEAELRLAPDCGHVRTS